MINLTSPPKPYEPYPGCSMEDFTREFLTRKPITVESFCMKEGIDPVQLPRLVREVLIDWDMSEPPHSSRKEAIEHMMNHLRIKIRNEKRNNTPRDSGSPSRGQHRNPTAYDIARELLGESSG
jgi:hypothetical protein